MKFVVAFDGSDISRAALSRAATLAAGVDGSVTALTVIPSRNKQYARDHGWLGPDEDWDRETVLRRIRESVAATSSDATFTYRMVDKYAPRGTIGRVLRNDAEAAAVDVFVIGSKNAGRIFTSLTTVARTVAASSFDIYVVRDV